VQLLTSSQRQVCSTKPPIASCPIHGAGGEGAAEGFLVHPCCIPGNGPFRFIARSSTVHSLSPGLNKHGGPDNNDQLGSNFATDSAPCVCASAGCFCMHCV
jgi:hypothetical protein